MTKIFHKSRKYPIVRDEDGRSTRRQAFDLFTEGYRPSQVFKEGLVAISMKTLLRYFEDWKKQKRLIPRSLFRKIMMGSPDSTEKYVQMLADYYEVPPEVIAIQLSKPWGIERLTKGELPYIKLERSRSEAEERLEGALRLVSISENIFRNPPKQINRFMFELMTLDDNTIMTILKVDGRIMIKKEKLSGTS
jgi:hypothetical protein